MAPFRRFTSLLSQRTKFSPQNNLKFSSRPKRSSPAAIGQYSSPVYKYIALVGSGVCFWMYLSKALQSHPEPAVEKLTFEKPPKNKKDEEKVNVKPANNASREQEDLQVEGLRKKYNFIDKIVKKCVPAVFYLEIRDPLRRDLETGEPLVTSNGSGFIISDDGYALTNAHVVLNKTDSMITAVLYDGTSYKAKVLDADLNVDIALLQLEGKEPFSMIPFAKPGDATVGEWVVALGSPLSLSNSVTVGIVSNVNRPAEELGLKNYSMTYIQTDASITFGNSGGPLVNLDGNVIGINNLRLTSGISFAIPIDYVEKFLANNRIMREGKKKPSSGRVLFGLTTISITSDLLNEMLRKNKIVPDEVTQGLLVWKVLFGSPAHKSGLEAGDIITHVNGIPVKEAADMYSISQKDKTVTVGIIHKGLHREIFLRDEQDS